MTELVSGDSNTFVACSLPLFSRFSGLIVMLDARILSILHDAVVVTVLMIGFFGIISAKAIVLLADTGLALCIVGPVPVWAFFGHDCIGHGQLEL
jgi:hypothetical protein